MRKYWEIAKVNFAEFFAWRLNFILYRMREFIKILIIFFLWSGLFEGRAELFGYTKEQMITYVLLAFFLSGFVQGTQTHEITFKLVSGEIINMILRPLSIFRYYFVRDVADKTLNLVSAYIEVSIVIWLFKPALFIQSDPATLFFFLFFILVGTGIAFFINIIISFLGFYTVETWAPRFIFYVLGAYLSGVYFPLDVLPKPIYYLLLATPLPYMQYLPAKIFIKGVDGVVIFEIIMSFVWLFVLSRTAFFFWKTGLKTYSFYGK